MQVSRMFKRFLVFVGSDAFVAVLYVAFAAGHVFVATEGCRVFEELFLVDRDFFEDIRINVGFNLFSNPFGEAFARVFESP